MNRRVNLTLHVTLRQRFIHPQVSAATNETSNQQGNSRPREHARAALTVLPLIQRTNAPLTVNEPANISQVTTNLRALTRHPAQATTLTRRQHNRRRVRSAAHGLNVARLNIGTLSARKRVRNLYRCAIGDNITITHALHVARSAQTATQTHQQTPSQTNAPTKKRAQPIQNNSEQPGVTGANRDEQERHCWNCQRPRYPATPRKQNPHHHRETRKSRPQSRRQ